MQDIRVTPDNYSSVNISWLPPEEPNGIIAEYFIKVEHHKINTERLMNVRPYCDENFGVRINEKPPEDEITIQEKEGKDGKA